MLSLSHRQSLVALSSTFIFGGLILNARRLQRFRALTSASSSPSSSSTPSRGPRVELERLSFLSPNQVRMIKQTYGTPVYVYSEAVLRENARKCLAFPNLHGLTVRYAMKALPNAAVLRFTPSHTHTHSLSLSLGVCRLIFLSLSLSLVISRLFKELGLHIDASSQYEVERALRAGYQPHQISLSSQQLAGNMKELIQKGSCIAPILSLLLTL